MKKSITLVAMMIACAAPALAYYDYDSYSSKTPGSIILLYVIMLAWGVLEIILFFKIWNMTRHVRELKEKIVDEVEVNNPVVNYFTTKGAKGPEAAKELIIQNILNDVYTKTTVKYHSRELVEEAYNKHLDKYAQLLKIAGIERPDITEYINYISPTEYKGLKIGDKFIMYSQDLVIAGFIIDKENVCCKNINSGGYNEYTFESVEFEVKKQQETPQQQED